MSMSSIDGDRSMEFPPKTLNVLDMFGYQIPNSKLMIGLFESH